MSQPNRNFENDDHALLSGMVLGLAWKHGINLIPVVDDDGNYTPRYELTDQPDFPLNRVRIFITIDPPEPKEVDGGQSSPRA